MAKDLNVSLGLLVQNFEKGLKSASRSLRQFSRKTERVGRTLTNSLSIPLGGAAIAAIKSAADFERLEKQLTSVTGSADETERQIAALKKIAEAPGLGFDQAVRAAARLQAVGLNAGQAQSAIQEFGNAVARSGGGAVEFDGAVLALTQIASKGKISAEEINQLNERIFEIRPALERAFGTSSSEELQKLGISSEEFIEKVTAEFAKLDRVQGGLFNSFENLGIAVRTFFADIGKVITELFPVQESVEKLSNFLGRLSERFTNLSEPVQRAIIAVAAVTAAIGPVILAISSIAAGLAAVLSPISLTIIAIGGLIAAFTALYNINQTFRDSVQVLALVMKTVVVNAFKVVGSAISALVDFLGLTKRNTEDASDEFQEFGAKSIFSISGVINAFETLAKVVFFPFRNIVGLGNAAIQVFNTIIEKARQISEAFRAGLNASNPIEGFKKTLAGLKGINTLDVGISLGKSFAEGYADGFNSIDIGGFFDKVRQDVSRAQESINATRFDKFLAGQAVSPELPQDPAEAATVGGAGVAGNALRTFTESIPLLQSGLTAIQSTSDNVTARLNESFLRVGESLTTSIEKTNALEAAQKKYNTALAVTNKVAGAISEGFGKMFSVILNGGKNAFGAFTDAIKQIVKELIIAVAKLAVFALISSILLPGAGSFATVFKGGFANLLKGGATPFASGGIVTQSTFANVGEQGAEAIIPLDRASDFMNQQELQVRVEGTELVALIKNSEKTYNRIF